MQTLKQKNTFPLKKNKKKSKIATAINVISLNLSLSVSVWYGITMLLIYFHQTYIKILAFYF